MSVFHSALSSADLLGLFGHFLTLSLQTPFRDEGFSGSAAVTVGRATEVNPGTSSQAFSNFSGRAAVNVRGQTSAGFPKKQYHFELWDAKAYAEHEAAVMQSEMPESLKNFSF